MLYGGDTKQDGGRRKKRKGVEVDDGSIVPPPSWHIFVKTEPPDEKLDEWGWNRISSGRKKDTGKNDGYFYISPKTQQKFRSKKKAKMFGLIVEYLDGNEDDAYEYITQIGTLFDNFIWGNPLKKTTGEYLMSLNWTQSRQLGDDGLMKKWWNPPECSKKFYSVAAAVNYVNSVVK